MYINIRSIRQHWEELWAILENARRVLDTIVLTEINIRSELLSLFELDNYSSYAYTRPVARGGGVLVYVRKERLVVSLDLAFSAAECIGLNIASSTLDIMLLAVYRPPAQNSNVFYLNLKALFDQFL